MRRNPNTLGFFFKCSNTEITKIISTQLVKIDYNGNQSFFLKSLFISPCLKHCQTLITQELHNVSSGPFGETQHSLCHMISIIKPVSQLSFEEVLSKKRNKHDLSSELYWTAFTFICIQFLPLRSHYTHMTWPLYRAHGWRGWGSFFPEITKRNKGMMTLLGSF